jgi:hypothetical protein
MRGIFMKMKETNLTVQHETGYIMIVQLKTQGKYKKKVHDFTTQI